MHFYFINNENYYRSNNSDVIMREIIKREKGETLSVLNGSVITERGSLTGSAIKYHNNL